MKMATTTMVGPGGPSVNKSSSNYSQLVVVGLVSCLVLWGPALAVQAVSVTTSSNSNVNNINSDNNYNSYNSNNNNNNINRRNGGGDDPLNGVQCNTDRLAIYKVVLHTYWSRDSFPKHYPDWRPPAQWSKTIGTCATGSGHIGELVSGIIRPASSLSSCC